MSNKRVIGIGGVARAGKDTFATILINKLEAAGKTVRRVALADPLKHHCNEFLVNNLGISGFTQIPEEKLIIRPFLVWYGGAQRTRTEGRYWIELASKTINQSKYDYYVITDIRYDVYQRDELYWLKTEWSGDLVHVSRWTKNMLPESVLDIAKEFQSRGVIKNLYSRDFVPPANDHERENDPKIKSASDFIVEWENVENKAVAELAEDESLIAHVDEFILERKLV